MKVFFQINDEQHAELKDFCKELSEERGGEKVTQENALLAIYVRFMKERKERKEHKSARFNTEASIP